MVTHSEFEQANDRATKVSAHTPRAVAARYDRRTRRIVVHLSSNLGLFFSPRNAQGLEHATADQLAEIEVSPSGYGLYFPQLDADLYLPSLLEGVFGSPGWIASRMGAQGGRSRSEAKTAASRENGKRGGRPARHNSAMAAK